jgi:hypothetical protein
MVLKIDLVEVRMETVKIMTLFSHLFFFLFIFFFSNQFFSFYSVHSIFIYWMNGHRLC